MSDDRLFALPEPIERPTDPTDGMSATQRLTWRNNDKLARGVHPATHRPVLAGWGFTCGDCVHFRRHQHHNGTYMKCARHRLGESHSAASDIRRSWPACVLFALEAT